METKGTTGEETTSYWFDLPIDVAEFEEKLGVGAESGDYRIIEKVLPFADEVHEHTSVYQLNELDFMYRQLWLLCWFPASHYLSGGTLCCLYGTDKKRNQ